METCQFIGTVGANPETRTTQSGKKVVSFSIAINKFWRNAQGEKEKSTKWIKCVAWDSTADTLEKYVQKGDRIFVAGEMDVNVWIDKTSGEAKGQLQLTVRQFEFLGGRQQDNGQAQSAQTNSISIPYDELPETYQSADAPF